VVIGGLQKFSLTDFPGLISAIVFTRGCGFRCPYCHNPDLVDPARYAAEYPQSELWKFLRSRRGLLKGVVVTGGEPTMHDDLPEFLRGLKEIGYSVKLDTNGTNPLLLGRVVAERLVDYVAMDIKAPLDLYGSIVNALVKAEDIQLSIEVLLRSGVSHEFRTTWVASLLTGTDILAIAELVKGCDRYILQSCSKATMLDPALAARPHREGSRLRDIAELVTAAGYPVALR
jgi:pyruvate formate lyase activating enzyme